MSNFKLQTPNLTGKFGFSRFALPLFGLLFLAATAFIVQQSASAQNSVKAQPLPPTSFRVGETADI